MTLPDWVSAFDDSYDGWTERDWRRFRRFVTVYYRAIQTYARRGEVHMAVQRLDYLSARPRCLLLILSATPAGHDRLICIAERVHDPARPREILSMLTRFEDQISWRVINALVLQLGKTKPYHAG